MIEELQWRGTKATRKAPREPISFTMQATQSFTSDGRMGVWAMLLSPVASGILWAWFLKEPGMLALTLLVASGLAFIGGCLLVLIGRRQTFIGQIERPAR